MYDLLADPGILVGELKVGTCQQGIDLHKVRAAAGADRKDDPAHLLVAQPDLAAGAETCPAAEGSVEVAQGLLLTAGFGGDKVLPSEAGQ